jgi:murein DD-endopeptidase MepM/ murein hydrolase activator NlpD
MKKLYFYSKTKLQFIEVKNFKSKLAVYTGLAVLFFSFLTLGGYFLYIVNSGQNLGSLKSENRVLKGKIEELSVLYKNLNDELEDLRKNNDVLRIAANLPPVSDEERKVGVGGEYFDINYDFFYDENDLKFNEAINFIDEVTRKINFEKDLYNKVSKKLSQNQKLYDAIPAIKPAEGYYSPHGFGMRQHPILKINKMHSGIDIVNDVGTPVYATGNGTVKFIGRKGGYGLVIEIDHGFGYRTVYAHLSKSTIKAGQKVSRGDLIGKSGNSGLSSGPHLHYEIHHNGIKLDPTEFFFDDMGFFELTKK